MAAVASLLLFCAASVVSACNHSAYNATAGKWSLDGCEALDLSCPDGESVSRAPACKNALLPREVPSLVLALAELEGAGVTSLDLRRSPVGPAGATMLAPALVKMTSLLLGSCRVGDKGTKAITQALLGGDAHTLQRLDLAHNSVSDDGVRPLATAIKLAGSSLVHLDLAWNAIGQRGGRYLGEALKESASLAELRLSYNGVADRGARALGEGLGVNSALELLDLGHNAIKDEGGKALAKGLRTNGKLSALLLGGNGLSNATKLEAEAALAMAPEQREAPARSAGASSAQPTRAAASEDDDDVEEINFDDDVEATAEAAAEAAAEARDRQEAAAGAFKAAEGGGGACVDAGPWECAEADCPSPVIDCPALAELGVCSSSFKDVWEESPPPGLGATVIATQCRKACGLCTANGDLRDEL